MLCRAVILIVLVTTAPSLFAADLADTLRTDYEKRALLLRGFYEANKLNFDSAGTLTSRSDIAGWTSSFVYIESLTTKENALEIKGKRVGLLFDEKQKRFKPGQSKVKVTITIAITPSVDSEAVVRKALDKIFIGPTEPLVPLVPAYWSSIVMRLNSEGAISDLPPVRKGSEACVDEASPQNTCGPGKKIEPPRITHGPDPRYDKVAESLKLQGTVMLYTVIDVTGRPTDIQIVRPFGCGLDDRAVATVSQWKFKPATRDGIPVPVQINIEINFRLF